MSVTALHRRVGVFWSTEVFRRHAGEQWLRDDAGSSLPVASQVNDMLLSTGARVISVSPPMIQDRVRTPDTIMLVTGVSIVYEPAERIEDSTNATVANTGSVGAGQAQLPAELAKLFAIVGNGGSLPRGFGGGG